MIRPEIRVSTESILPTEKIYQSLLRFQNACLCATFFFDYEANPALYTPRKKSHFTMSDTDGEFKIEQSSSYTSLVTQPEIQEMLDSIELVDLEAALVTVLDVVTQKIKLTDDERNKIANEQIGIFPALDVIIRRLNKLSVEVGRLNALEREGHDVTKHFVLVLYMLNNVFKDNKNSNEVYSKYFTMVMGW